MKHKLCFLTYGQQAAIVKEVLNSVSYADTEISLANCNVDSLSSHVAQARDAGCQVFIASSGNAAEFKRSCSSANTYLVELQLRTIDYLIYIRKALNIGSKIAVTRYRYSRAMDIELLSTLSDCEVIPIEYEDSDELSMAMKNCEADVIVGGAHACNVAEYLGRRYVYLAPSEETVKSAVVRARQLAITLHERKTNRILIDSIITHAPYGIVFSDAEGNIELFNQKASDLTLIPSSQVARLPYETVFPNIGYDKLIQGNRSTLSERHVINGVMLNCELSRVDMSGEFVGVLTTLRIDNSRSAKAVERINFLPKESMDDIIAGSSGAVEQLRREAVRIASRSSPVAIIGEKSTSRTQLARFIHSNSPRRDQHFLVVDAAAVPDAEVSRFLYGGEQQGLFEYIGSGTLVFVNLSLASPIFQAVLSTALKQRFFIKPGSFSQIPINARFMLTAEPSLPDTLDRDLWNRLSVQTIHTPMLKERGNDVIPLFINRYEKLHNKILRHKLSPDALDLLTHYDWPGNLTELSSVCERFVSLAEDASSFDAIKQRYSLIDAIGKSGLQDSILAPYKDHIINVMTCPTSVLNELVVELRSCLGYNYTQIAELLSISRTTLWRLMKRGEAQPIP